MQIIIFKRKLAGFFGKPAFVKYWLAPTWIILGLSRVAIQAINFKYISLFLGRRYQIDAQDIHLLRPEQRRFAFYIKEVIRLAAQLTPWESNCFCQVIASRLILGVYKIPYSIFFGVLRDPSDEVMKAHAWVFSGDILIGDNSKYSSFTVVACFSNRSHS